MKQMLSEEVRQAVHLLRDERIELKLVVITTNLGRFAAIHNTKAIP